MPLSQRIAIGALTKQNSVCADAPQWEFSGLLRHDALGEMEGGRLAELNRVLSWRANSVQHTPEARKVGAGEGFEPPDSWL